MEPSAASLYEIRLRVRGRGPTLLLVPVVFARNVIIGALGWFGDTVAPADIDVIRRADKRLVGRIPATSGFYEQSDLLAAVRRSLESCSAADFLATWDLVDE